MKRLKEIAKGICKVFISIKKTISDKGKAQTRWIIERWASEEDRKAGKRYSPAECLKLFGIKEQFSIVHQNILLNEGINELWTILCSSGGTKYDNSNAQLGVGDGTAAESATQTDLQGTNKTWKGMESGFPTYGTSQKATWKSSFGSAEGNHDWEEFSVRNGATADKNLNRKKSSQGTKQSGQTWELTLEISLS